MSDDAVALALKGLEENRGEVVPGEAGELLQRYQKQWSRLDDKEWRNQTALGPRRVSEISQRLGPGDWLLSRFSAPRLMALGMTVGCLWQGTSRYYPWSGLSATVAFFALAGLCWLLPAQAAPLDRGKVTGVAGAYWLLLAPILAQLVSALIRSNTFLSDQPLSLRWLAQVSGEVLREAFSLKIWLAGLVGALLGALLARGLGRRFPWVTVTVPGRASSVAAWTVLALGLVGYGWMSVTLHRDAEQVRSQAYRPTFEILHALARTARDPYWGLERVQGVNIARYQEWPQFRASLNDLEPFLGKDLMPGSVLPVRNALDSVLARLCAETFDHDESPPEAVALKLHFLKGELGSQVKDRKAGRMVWLYARFYRNWGGSATCQALASLLDSPRAANRETLLELRALLLELRLSPQEYATSLRYEVANQLPPYQIEALARGEALELRDPHFMFGWIDVPEVMLQASLTAARLRSLEATGPLAADVPIDLATMQRLDQAIGQSDGIAGSLPIYVNLCLAGVEKRLGLIQTVTDPALVVGQDEVSYPSLGARLYVPAR